jgi:hypothetical protein
MKASAGAGVFFFWVGEYARLRLKYAQQSRKYDSGHFASSRGKIPDDFLFLSAVAGPLIYVSNIPIDVSHVSIGVSPFSIHVSRLSIDVKEMSGKGRRIRAALLKP